MSADINFVIPPDADPKYFRWFATDDVDLAVGEIVKMSSNKPTAVGVDEQADTICGVVTDKRPSTGNVTDVEVYFGPRLKMPVEAAHHMPGIGDPVYCSSKSAVSGDGANVAADAAAIGSALEVGGSAGDGYAWISCRWPFWENAPADSS